MCEKTFTKMETYMKQRTKNTKEAYLLEALRLFAEKGYEAVGVVEIAQAVGCTTSALYKHFSGKKALFDAIVERSEAGFSENMERFRNRFVGAEAGGCSPFMTEEEQLEMMRGLFGAVTEDGFPKLFRKLATVEQFKHPELARIYNERYVKSQYDAFEKLMRAWVESGALREDDSAAMAAQYVSPVIVAIGMCDRDPAYRDEALAMLEAHVRQFNRVYRATGGTV